MNKSSFLIVGQHAVIEALRNPKRKVLKVFLTEESKKNIHRKNPKKNVLEDVKVYFKSKKELDKYTSKDQIMHGGYVAEVEHIDQPDLKEFIKGKNNLTFVCLQLLNNTSNVFGCGSKEKILIFFISFASKLVYSPLFAPISNASIFLLDEAIFLIVLSIKLFSPLTDIFSLL